MSLISFSPLADGVTAVNAAATNTPLSTIYNDYNGNITNANISASAAIAGSKVNLASIANPYKFYAYQSSGQAVASTGSNIKVSLQTKLFDTGTNFDTTTFLFTAPISGFYFFSWCVTYPIANNSICSTYLLINGAATNGLAGQMSGNSTGGSQTLGFVGSGLLQLSASDTAGLYVNAGNTATINAFRSQTFLTGYLVSAT